MSILIIREHSRFAVCRRASVWLSDGGTAEALLVELSLAGCRLGNLPASAASPGDDVSIEVSDGTLLCGTVRWRVDGSVGLKFTKPLHTYELDRLIRLCRGNASGRTAARA